MEPKTTKAAKEVLDAAKKYKIDARIAAYTIFIKRVADAMKLRGWY